MGERGYKKYTLEQLNEIYRLLPVGSHLKEVMEDVDKLLSKDIDVKLANLQQYYTGMVQDDYVPSIEKEVKSIRTALSTFRQEEKLVKIRSRVVILWDYIIEKSGKMGYKTYTDRRFSTSRQ